MTAIVMTTVGALILVVFFGWAVWAMLGDLGLRITLAVTGTAILVTLGSLLFAFGVSELIT